MKSSVLAAVALALAIPSGTGGQKTKERYKGIACPMVNPKVKKVICPVYPEAQKKAGIKGDVSLWCIISSNGSVENIAVIKGQEPFIHIAKAAVAQWKYEPVRVKGVAVQSISVNHHC